MPNAICVALLPSVSVCTPLPPPLPHPLYLMQVVSWLKGHVSSKYPLVAASTLQASEAAVDRLQVMLPGLLPLGTAAVGKRGCKVVAWAMQPIYSAQLSFF